MDRRSASVSNDIQMSLWHSSSMSSGSNCTPLVALSSGTNVAAHPARFETSNGKELLAALVDDKAPWLRKARQDKGSCMGIPAGKRISL